MERTSSPCLILLSSITPHLMSSLNKLSTSTSAWSPPFLLRDREQVLSLRACLRARPSPKGHTIQVCPRYHNGLRCCSEGAGAPSLRTVALAVFVAALTKKQLLDDDVPIQDRKRKRVVFEEHEDDLERSIPMYKHLLLSSSKSQLNPPLDSKSSGRNACPKRAAQQGASIIPGAPRERAPAAPLGRGLDAWHTPIYNRTASIAFLTDARSRRKLASSDLITTAIPPKSGAAIAGDKAKASIASTRHP